jgi:hypothetical protein
LAARRKVQKNKGKSEGMIVEQPIDEEQEGEELKEEMTKALNDGWDDWDDEV